MRVSLELFQAFFGLIVALAGVIKDVLRRVEQTGDLKKGGGGKASVTLYRVPSATERRE